jgi:diaminopimelate epimerase
MKLNFTKMHGLGNDFIIIDNRKGRYRKLKHASKNLCDRRFGIGADQLLVLTNSKKADFKMIIYNADGSEVEMCGNGIRCVAQYVWEKNLKRSPILSFETRAGIIRSQQSGDAIKVDMGRPSLDPNKIPVRIGKNHGPSLAPRSKSGESRVFDPVINYPLLVGETEFRGTCVSMGNPHTVIVAGDVDSVPLETVGPLLENHRLFPNRTNVEFIQILDKKNIRMRVWERGAGETMACGTGACASAVASFFLGLTERRVKIHLPGGTLNINWSILDGHVYMTGPAVKVFEGTIDI